MSKSTPELSAALLLQAEELKTAYHRADGKGAVLYLDANYNTTFALMHPDFEADSRPWEGIGNERRTVQLNVLSPVDLAVSKISRASSRDLEDIRTLAADGLITAQSVRRRADEAMGYYIGNSATVRQNIDRTCQEISGIVPNIQGKLPRLGFGPTP